MRVPPNVVLSDKNSRIYDPGKLGVVIIGLADATPDDWCDKAADVLSVMQKTWPKDCRILIAYSGYDDDPRALWEIEMPARKIARFTHALWNAGFPQDRVDRDSSLLLTACSAAALQFEKGAGHA